MHDEPTIRDEQSRCPHHGAAQAQSIDITIEHDGAEWELADGYTLDICPECLREDADQQDRQIRQMFDRVTSQPKGSVDIPEDLPMWRPGPDDPSPEAYEHSPWSMNGAGFHIKPISERDTWRAYSARCNKHGVMKLLWIKVEYDDAVWRIADGYLCFACEECLGESLDFKMVGELNGTEQLLARQILDEFESHPTTVSLTNSDYFTRVEEGVEG